MGEAMVPPLLLDLLWATFPPRIHGVSPGLPGSQEVAYCFIDSLGAFELATPLASVFPRTTEQALLFHCDLCLVRSPWVNFSKATPQHFPSPPWLALICFAG